MTRTHNLHITGHKGQNLHDNYLLISCLMQYRAIFICRNNVQTAIYGLSRRQPTQGKTIACTLALTHNLLHYIASCWSCCSAGCGLVSCLLISPQTYLHMHGKCDVCAPHAGSLIWYSLPVVAHRITDAQSCSCKHANGLSATHLIAPAF